MEVSNPPIASALEAVAANNPNPYVRQAATRALLTPAHQPFTSIREIPPTTDSTTKSLRGSEVRTARDWYWWLWLSPFLTLPTLIALWSYYTFGGVSILIAILGSALWHLFLLIPALGGQSEFVRWHGTQMLLLAGVRTAVPLVFVLTFGGDMVALWVAIPVLIVVWLSGTLWCQLEAARGDCTLMRWFGRAEALPARRRAVESAQANELDPEALVGIIRYSRDPERRRQALAELEKLGMVESL